MADTALPDGDICRAGALLIIAHAPSPNTRQLRDAMVCGAQSQAASEAEVRALSAFEAQADDVLAAQGIILFTPENFGYMSGALKDFFDRTFYALLEQTDGMPYALVIRAGKDGTGTQRAVSKLCTGLNWKPVQPALICRGDYRAEFERQCETLGANLAAGISMGIY